MTDNTISFIIDVRDANKYKDLRSFTGEEALTWALIHFGASKVLRKIADFGRIQADSFPTHSELEQWQEIVNSIELLLLTLD